MPGRGGDAKVQYATFPNSLYLTDFRWVRLSRAFSSILFARSGAIKYRLNVFTPVSARSTSAHHVRREYHEI